jgi:Flp pilus assembly protein CpaB
VPTSPIVLVVRARRAVARPGVRRLAVAVLAVATALTVTGLVRAAEAARDRWGDRRPVVVAVRDLAPGEVLEAGAVETRDLPVAAVADAAVAEAPVGAVVRQPIAAGEPVVASRLAPHGLTGTAALVPPGRRAVAVPTGPALRPPVVVGDLVDVVVVLPGEADAVTSAEPAFPLVEGAAVVAVGDEAVTVAVPRAEASRLAWAVGTGSVVLALVGA